MLVSGFTSDAFRSLELKVADARSNGGGVLCALMIDEMAVRKKLEWDGEKMFG